MARVTSPFSISDALAVVPPMSNEIALPMPMLAGQRLHPDDAGGRAAFDDVHRRFGRRLGGGQPAIRLHQQQRRRRCRCAATRAISRLRYCATIGRT